MRKLSETQLKTLSKAAAREDSEAAAPAGMGNPAAARIATSLVGRKPMREIRAKPCIPVWRNDCEGGPLSLVVTRAGRDGIGAVDKAKIPGRPGQGKPSENMLLAPRSL